MTDEYEGLSETFAEACRRADEEHRKVISLPDYDEETRRRPPPLNWLPPFLDGDPPPEQQWAIRDRIPLQQVALYSGEGAAGKSITALHLCVAHVLGKDWLYSLPEPGPAFFIDCEDGPDVLHRRLDAMRMHYGTSFAEIYQGGLHVMSMVGQDSLLAVAPRNGILSATPFYAQLLQAAGDLKPKMIAIASLANIFGGVEFDRSQVQQFVVLMRRIAIAANGSVLLISHPSLTGINSDSGLSGSTQWHNAVRARLFLKGVKPENGDPAESDVRLLEFRKNQYGPPAHSVTLRWKDGLFLPEGTGDSLDKLAKDSRAEEVFITILRRLNEANRTVSDNPAAPTNYAPRTFLTEPEAIAAKVNKLDLEKAMARLFKSNKIRLDEWGPVSKRRKFIVIN